MRRIKLFVTALVLSLSSVLAIDIPRALAATITWDGSAGNGDPNTAENWVGDQVPGPEDIVVFPANVENRTINIASATTWAGIQFTGEATSSSSYIIGGGGGGTLTIGSAGITNSMTGSGSRYQFINANVALDASQTWTTGAGLGVSGNVDLSSYTLTINAEDDGSSIGGVISGAGGIIKNGTGEFALTSAEGNTFKGAVAVNGGTLVARGSTALGTAEAGTTVASGASLYFFPGTSGDITIAEPLTLSGTGVSATEPTIQVNQGYGGGGGGGDDWLTIFSGPITLNSDIKVGAYERKAKITGPITGKYSIGFASNSTSSFEIASSSNESATPNGMLAPEAKETKYEEDSPNTPIMVVMNETAIVTGHYGYVTVGVGGILKGTGTVGGTFVYGTIAPGLSPGCLNTGNLTIEGTYEFEIGGTTACDGYDQIKVTGTVKLSGKLSVSRYNNFVPKAGQKYVIIDNDGSDAVDGTFTDLPEGATFEADGVTFSISYVGGDGNDVELTVVAVSPDTGFALLTNNPFVAMALMLGAAGGVALIARRQFRLGFAAVRRRR
jgi:fibronectin-binding autotransporter adhesin